MLLISVPLWFCIYLYLDQVVPSEYGINRHPCFCLMRQRRDEEYQLDYANDLEGQGKNEKIFNESDPIKF